MDETQHLDFPFSRLREKVPEGRMRVLVHLHNSQIFIIPSTIRAVRSIPAELQTHLPAFEPHPHPAFGHPLPQAQELSGESLWDDVKCL
jgi:hypothetical protein